MPSICLRLVIVGFLAGIPHAAFSGATSAWTLLSILGQAERADPALKIKQAETAQAHWIAKTSAAALGPQLDMQSQHGIMRYTNPNLQTENETYSLQLNQVLFSPQLSRTSEANRVGSEAARKRFEMYQQTERFEVATRYFNVLSAKHNLTYSKSQVKAFQTSFEQAEQRYKAGIVAITDVHEARARLDNAKAEVLRSDALVLSAEQRLEELIHRPARPLSDLRSSPPWQLPSPFSDEAWIQLALQHNLDLQATTLDLKAARQQWRAQMAAYGPSVSASAQVGRGSSNTLFQPRSSYKASTLQVSLPLFESGQAYYQVKRYAELFKQKEAYLDQVTRTVQSQIRQLYQNTRSQWYQIAAYEKTVISSQSALSANEAAYEAGTRTLVDVLNAQSAFLKATRDLQQSKYDFVLGFLQLHYTAGLLDLSVLRHIDTWLEPA